MATRTAVMKTECLTKYGGNVRELAMVVLARMRDDEAKLIRQAKKLIKSHKTLAAQILTTDIDGWYPLHACALRGSKKLLKVFLNSGVDINTPMGEPEGLPTGCTLLHMASLRGDLKILELLISRGAYLNATDSNGTTPVIYAARRRHRRAVRLLEEHGANMTGTEPSPNNELYDCVTPQPTHTSFCFFWK